MDPFGSASGARGRIDARDATATPRGLYVCGLSQEPRVPSEGFRPAVGELGATVLFSSFSTLLYLIVPTAVDIVTRTQSSRPR